MTKTTLQYSVLDSQSYKKKIFEICPTFKVNEFNKDILNELFCYINGDSVTLNPKKGIWFYGDIGTGKTTLMKILAESQRLQGRGFKCVHCAELSAKYAANGLDALNESTFNSLISNNPVERGFDELGREQNPSKHFGNELNVMEYIFSMRYELRNTVRTHITTNLNIESIPKLYNDYIYDRLNEMFNFIELKGESFR